jgi:hypothetical protein
MALLVLLIGLALCRSLYWFVFLPLLLRSLLVVMPGPSCERVARCREKSRTRRFAVSQGFLRQPVFATAGASFSLPSHPFQPSHVLPAAQVSVPPTTSE